MEHRVYDLEAIFARYLRKPSTGQYESYERAVIQQPSFKNDVAKVAATGLKPVEINYDDMKLHIGQVVIFRETRSYLGCFEGYNRTQIGQITGIIMKDQVFLLDFPDNPIYKNRYGIDAKNRFIQLFEI